MSELSNLFDQQANRVVDKWRHYLDIYDRHFSALRQQARASHKRVVLLEIGMQNGGSMEMWNAYFGVDNVQLYGIDIDPRCKQLEETIPNVKIFIGDQADAAFLEAFKNQTPTLDILVDDGGHKMSEQIATFNHLYGHVNENGGIYICEDLHTSYWPDFHGGCRKSGTFVEYMKLHIDQLNADHSREGDFVTTPFTRTADSMHFYTSMVVIEKRPKSVPISVQKGTKRLG
jgi:hypothetical protein